MEETMTTFEQLPEMMAILLKKVESLETSIIIFSFCLTLKFFNPKWTFSGHMKNLFML